MKLIKFLTLIMILLVLSMPIVSAATLTGYGYGQDGIKNFVRKNDQLTLQVVVQGESVIPEKIEYLPSVGQPIDFDECNDDYCSLVLPEQEFDSKIYEYKVRFTGQSGQNEKLILITPDVIGPQLEDVSTSSYLVSLNDQLTFTMRINDLACSTSSCNEKCSGIKYVKIFKDDMKNEVQEIVLNTEECSQIVEKTFDVSDLTTDEGLNKFFFEAVDNFGNKGNVMELDITVDSTPPIIEKEIFYLTKNGTEIEYYNKPIKNVDFLFYVDEDSKNVKADLSQLNPSIGIVDLDCTGVLCKKTINLNLGNVEDNNKLRLEVNVELVDELNNLANYDLKNEIKVDKTGPTVKKITSSSLYKQSKVIGYGNNATIYVEVQDKGIGINNGNVYVDFSEINSEFSSVKAKSCTDGVCEFTGIPIINDGLKQIKVLRLTRDDLDNYLAEEYIQNIYSDKTLPSLTDVIVEFEKTEYDGRPSKGDKLHVVAYLTDASKVTAVGNFSEISDQGIIDGKCKTNKGSSSTSRTFERFSRGFTDSSSTVSTINSDNNDEAISGNMYCEWDVEVTKSGTIIDKQALLSFKDEFGNVLDQNIDIPIIYGLKDEEHPNYWSSSVTCSPSTLDREIGELIEQEMYCTVHLEPSTSLNQEITSLELAGCENNYVKDEELGNDKTTDPYISLIFDKTEYGVNNIQIPCILEIKSTVGNEIVTNTEEEEVNINVGFYNNPYGMPDDNLIEEINDIRETWAEGFGTMIHWLSIIERVSTMICKGMNTITAITKVLDIKVSFLPSPKGDVARGVAEGVSKGTDTTWGMLQHYCSFVNCEMGKDEDGMLSYVGGSKVLGVVDLKGLSYAFGGGGYVDSLGGHFEDYMNVKNNIYLSAVTLCIPGIIYNLQKYRQIQCSYGYCLQDLSVEQGVPYAVCEEQKAYEECKYFVGPIFTLFPIVNLFNQMFDLVKQAISDPFAMIGVAANLYCGDFSQVGWSLCRVVEIINVGAKAYEDVIGIIDEIGEITHDYCDDLKDSPRSSSSSGHSSGGSRGYV